MILKQNLKPKNSNYFHITLSELMLIFFSAKEACG